jgi:chondroitin AC lyase
MLRPERSSCPAAHRLRSIRLEEPFVKCSRPAVLAIAFFLSSLAAEHAQTAAAPSQIAKNFSQSIVAQDGGAALASKAYSLAATETSDGNWSDISYQSKADMNWPLQDHLHRMELLAAAAYAARDTGHPDPKLDGKAISALRFWLNRDFQNSNWWWGTLWIPLEGGKTALLLQPSLTPQDKQAAAKLMARTGNFKTYTGENLVWARQVEILGGILQGNEPNVVEGFHGLFADAGYTEDLLPGNQRGEGIMSDNSFHQHGALLYSGGYGLTFAQDVMQMILISWHTPFQIAPDRLNTFIAFLLDGDQWMIRGATFDHATAGREITWPDLPRVGSNSVFQRLVQQLAAKPIPRQAEMKAFADRLLLGDSVASPDSPVNGDRFFWHSDYLVSRRSPYLASLRMFSTRTRNSELVGGQGLRSVHLADGMNLLYRSGNEYLGIFPVWDWTLIPGTTALHASMPNGVPQTFEVNNIMQTGATAFVGAVTDGHTSAAAMDLRRGPLQARKAWFFFDGVYLCLGAGIRAVGPQASDDDIATDINQTLARGSVQIGPQQQFVVGVRKGIADTASRFVLHDRVGYLLWPGTHFVVSSQSQVGAWSDIGTGPRTPVSHQVFNLWIDHGPRPASGTYTYAVFPDTSVEQMNAAASAPPLAVFSNTETLQSVYNPAAHLVALIFYTAGAAHSPLGEISVDKPSMLLVRRLPSGFAVTASEPTHQTTTLRIAIGSRSGSVSLADGRSATLQLQ